MLHLLYHGNVFWLTEACKPVVNTSIWWLSTAQNTCCIYFSVPALYPPYSFPISNFFPTLSSGAHSLLQEQQNNIKCLQILAWLKICLKCLRRTQFPMSRQPVASLLKLKNPACICRKDNSDEPKIVNKSLRAQILNIFKLTILLWQSFKRQSLRKKWVAFFWAV